MQRAMDYRARFYDDYVSLSVEEVSELYVHIMNDWLKENLT